MEPVTDRPTDWRMRVRESRAGTLVVLFVTAAVVLLGTYLVDRTGSAADSGTAVEVSGDQSGPPEVGATARDFTATTIDGQQVSLSDYRGQPVWLTFGASWCASCRAEAPDIQAAYEKAKADGVVVLAVYLSEDAGTVRGFADRLGLRYLHVPDPDARIASAYGVLGVPAHYFIDRSGVVRSIDIGVLTADRMDTALAGISG